MGLSEQQTYSGWPECPSCGHEHREAWEWDFGPALDGERDTECDSCGAAIHVERSVLVTYVTSMRKEPS